jgi:hypothetical protein
MPGAHRRGEMKSVLVLNISLNNTVGIWQRRLGFEISDLPYLWECQHMDLNILQRCKECFPSNRDHFWNVL